MQLAEQAEIAEIDAELLQLEELAEMADAELAAETVAELAA